MYAPATSQHRYTSNVKAATYCDFACEAFRERLNSSNDGPPMGYRLSKSSISWSRRARSSLFRHTAAKSLGVAGVLPSKPLRILRSAGLVKDVRKSAVVWRGAHSKPRLTKKAFAVSIFPK